MTLAAQGPVVSAGFRLLRCPVCGLRARIHSSPSAQWTQIPMSVLYRFAARHARCGIERWQVWRFLMGV